MKSILRPTFTKIILALVLVLVSSYLWRMYIISTISDTFPWGFPFQFYTAWGPCPPGRTCSESNVFYLVIDLVFWYLISAFGIARFSQFRA